ncbi:MULTISPECIES: sigma-70 family RNA polymerase sigma factor [unclassified Sphingopyxis]|uniref:sigma-70 family RNA polymerase sigma factor n=1 Tax=unclassified Sphingopyxis TaxID=2614943 RepID=UPI000A5EF68E|nr:MULTISPECIES: sigma-70 family RNA polymerase sigma factor [unclassified Sphingopyxis]
MTAPLEIAVFNAVYRAEHQRLLRKLRRRVGPDEAPDLAQEAFARLLGSGALERLDNPQAYLSRITRNLLIDRVRRKQRGCPIFFPLDEDRIPPAPPEQTRRIEAIDLQRLYRRTVRAMPPKTRRVFVMHRVHRLTYKQIAAELGVCIQTVDYHMMRGLALCRAAIAAQW